MSENNEFLEFSLGLLDQLMTSSKQRNLTKFAALESVVDRSLDSQRVEPSPINASSKSENTAIEAPKVSSSPANSQNSNPLFSYKPKTSGSKITNSDNFKKTHFVSSTNFKTKNSQHLEKNEKLIQALQELRSKMNEKGLRSGKVIRASQK